MRATDQVSGSSPAGGPRKTSDWPWVCAALGALVVMAGKLLPGDNVVQAVAQDLRLGGWLALALGVAVLVWQMARPRPVDQSPFVPAPAGDAGFGATRPSVLAALGGVRTAGSAEIEPRFEDTIAIHPADEDDAGWSPRVLARMDSRRFDAFCQAFLIQAGFSTSARPIDEDDDDGGQDIWIKSRHLPAPRIVRCRHWHGDEVPVQALREFLASMSAQGLEHGTYVTSSYFTAEALEFAKANGIQAQDGRAILKLVSHRSAQQQAALMAVATGERSRL